MRDWLGPTNHTRAITVGGAVVRIGDEVLRFAPPLSSVRSSTDGTRWEVTARDHRCNLRLVDVGPGDPHVLPVPIPAERRNVDTDFEYLAAHMTIKLTGAVRYSGESHLAGVETGYRLHSPPSNLPASSSYDIK